MRKTRLAMLLVLWTVTLPVAILGAGSTCVTMGEAGADACWPYNARLIDGVLLAGGSPFGPTEPHRTPAEVAAIFAHLPRIGIRTVVILHVPANDRDIRLEERLAVSAGLRPIRLPMNAERVPTATETEMLLKIIGTKAYIHCQWGADRTGAVLAMYLRACCGYSGHAAWAAVIKGGSHAGRIGGLKIDPKYARMVKYFWPEVTREDPDVCRQYHLTYQGSR
jgi:hypothetical protein